MTFLEPLPLSVGVHRWAPEASSAEKSRVLLSGNKGGSRPAWGRRGQGQEQRAQGGWCREGSVWCHSCRTLVSRSAPCVTFAEALSAADPSGRTLGGGRCQSLPLLSSAPASALPAAPVPITAPSCSAFPGSRPGWVPTRTPWLLCLFPVTPAPRRERFCGPRARSHTHGSQTSAPVLDSDPGPWTWAIIRLPATPGHRGMGVLRGRVEGEGGRRGWPSGPARVAHLDSRAGTLTVFGAAWKSGGGARSGGALTTDHWGGWHFHPCGPACVSSLPF